jgi:hypothetical protein
MFLCAFFKAAAHLVLRTEATQQTSTYNGGARLHREVLRANQITA